MKYDFAIVCPQRGGSCFLSTALNSHPDIWCDSGTKELELERGKERKITGVVIRYNVLSEVGRTNPKKIIHLQRDLTQAALSLIVHKWNRGSLGRSLHKLRTESLTIDVSPLYGAYSDFFILALKETLEEQACEVRWAIGSRPCLNISYEELTFGGKDVEELPEDPTKRLLEFLEVPISVLRTSLGKTGPYI